jgi:hypothetical protein
MDRQMIVKERQLKKIARLARKTGGEASEPKLDSALPFQNPEISCSLKRWPYQSLLLVPDHLYMAFSHKSVEDRFQR